MQHVQFWCTANVVKRKTRPLLAGAVLREVHMLSLYIPPLLYLTEVRFASFLSGGFITALVVNPPERKLAKRTLCSGY